MLLPRDRNRIKGGGLWHKAAKGTRTNPVLQGLSFVITERALARVTESQRSRLEIARVLHTGNR